MKTQSKKILKLSSLFLSIIIVLGIFCTIIGGYIRGGIDKYLLPDGFSEAMEQIDPKKDNNEIRIMTSNVLVHFKSWGGTDSRPRAKMFFEMVNTYKPDVIALQEVSDQWYDCIIRNKGSYKMLYPVSTGVLFRMTALVYNSDTLNLLDKGQITYDEGNNPRLRRAVWGIFESKATNEKFAVISTHFDTMRPGEEETMSSYMQTQSRQIIEISNNIKEEYNIPVFCAGDFNSMNAGGIDPVMDAPEIYENLCKSLTDTKDIAVEKISGDACEPDAPTWDHIFLNGDAKISRYVILSPKILSQMSDHYPIYADVKIGDK